MKFLQKRWVAISLCILMFLTGFVIGQARQPVPQVPEVWATAVKNTSVYDWYMELQSLLPDVMEHVGAVVGGIVIFVLLLLLLVVLAVASALTRLCRRVTRRRK